MRSLVCCTLLCFILVLTPTHLFAHDTHPLTQDSSPLVARSQDKQGLIEVTLRTNSVATSGAVVDLSLEVRPMVNAPGLTITWLLPDGGELLGGGGEEQLSTVAAKQTLTSRRQVRFPAPGIYQVIATASAQVNESMTVAAAGVLFFNVQADGTASVLQRDPRLNLANQRIIPTTLTVEDATIVRSADAEADPCFVINGTLTRLDRNPNTANNSAFTNSRVPVRNVPVDMMEEDTLFDDYYGTKVTDANGNFDFQFCDDDGIFDDELELYVIVRAEMWDNGRKVVYVEDSSWIDEMHEFESEVKESEGGTLRFDMAMDLNADLTRFDAGAAFQSEVFNIADAVFDAYRFWNAAGGATGDDATFADTTEVHYEPGYDDTGSYYQPFWNEITVADGPADNDAWDDGVIQHEWMHFADDVYGCDDTPGGAHSFFQLTNDVELAWSEGYSNYFQSAVRLSKGDPNSNFYLDILSSGTPGNRIDLETWNTSNATLTSVFNEGAIAAMLWDLQDATPSNDDTNDRVGYGHRLLQEVFTDPAFEANGDVFDDTCSVQVYLRAWRDLNKPANLATAAAVSQNIGYTPPGFDKAALTQQVAAAAPQAEQALNVAPNAVSTDYRWWKQLTWVVDNSTSMAGPKLDGSKTVINEQLNDLKNDPKGVDFNLYTFNHESNLNKVVFTNEFYADRIQPQINGIAATSSLDLDCGSTVGGLQAMSAALANKRAGDLWLFTDGVDSQFPRVETVVQALTRQRVRGSIALLGGCATPPSDANKLNGAQGYLGAAAGAQPSGIVPYLITALRSGGNFLFVDPGQIGNAADILRAQLANSAGAGRWSDYVSDEFTYRWDRLLPHEYQWFQAEGLGQGEGQVPDTGYLIYTMPNAFNFYGSNMTSVGVSQDGLLEFNPCTGQTCPIIVLNRFFLDILNSDLQWNYIPFPPRAAATDAISATTALSATVESAAAAAPDPNCAKLFTANPPYGPQVCVFSANFAFEWHIVSVQGYDATGVYRAYQIWLNHQTGEIRYQYDRLRSEAGAAEIGLRTRSSIPFPNGSTTKLLVSNKDSNGASNGMGYKFTPAPPQPTKTYTVAVDALMDGIGFLLTGYSGDFEAMIVRTPDGTAVDCNDTANVLCLNLGKVQFVQVNVNGRAGNWTATVDAAPPSNQATFSFNAIAASSVGAEVISDHTLPRGQTAKFVLKLGRPAAGNVITGWLQQPNGQRWGDEFALYDDGLHDDLRAGDGFFGSDGVTPPGVGVAYLWARGTADGVEFIRTDPAAFVFQPLQVKLLTPSFSSDNDEQANVLYEITNSASTRRCFAPDITLPDQWASWSYNWDFDVPGSLCLNAGETQQRLLKIFPAWYEAPSGSTAEVTFAFHDVNDPTSDDSVTVQFLRQRAPYRIVIDNAWQSTYIRPNNTDTVTLQVAVFDEQGVFAPDGTAVQLATDLGTITPVNGLTEGGLLQALFKAGTQPGDATITASVGAISATTVIHIRAPLPDRIDLVATPTDLSGAANSSALLATVHDRWGGAVANQTVRIGVADDHQRGTINGSEVVTVTTNAQGQVLVTFTKAEAATGSVGVRAELLVSENGNRNVVQEARTTLLLSADAAANKVYLPMVQRN